MVLHRIATAAKRAYVNSQKATRRNRLWVVIVRGGDKFYLVEPSYYETHAPEADQRRRLESPLNAGKRLCSFMFEGVESVVHYLKKYELRGGASYSDLYVCYVCIKDDAVLAPELEARTRMILTAVSPSQRKLARQVLVDLQERFSHEPEVILQELLQELKERKERV